MKSIFKYLIHNTLKIKKEEIVQILNKKIYNIWKIEKKYISKQEKYKANCIAKLTRKRKKIAVMAKNLVSSSMQKNRKNKTVTQNFKDTWYITFFPFHSFFV